MFQELVEAECKNIASAAAVVNGQFLPASTVLQDIVTSDDSSRLDVELLSEPLCALQHPGPEPDYAA